MAEHTSVQQAPKSSSAPVVVSTQDNNLKRSLIDDFQLHQTAEVERGARPDPATPSAIKRHGVTITAVLVCNNMVGSGILNQAQVFAEAGIAATTVLYAFGMVTVWVGSVVLIEAAHALQLVGAQLDYRVVATITYGQSGGRAADAVIAIGNFAANLSYILLIGSISANLLQDWTGSTGSPFTHAYFTTPVLSFGVIFPLCLVRHFTEMSGLAFMGLSAVLVVMLLVMCVGPAGGAEVSLDDGEPLVLWNWLEMFERAGSVIFALSFAPAALHAYMGLVPCTPEQWRKVVSIAIAVGAVVCYTTGIIGYLSFRGATLGNILENFDGVVSDIASVLLVAHLAWYTPSEFVIMRHSVFQLCGKAPLVVSSRLLFLTTALLLGLMVAICVALSATGVASGEAFGIILNLSGGIIGSIVSFILPALMYKRALPEGRWAWVCRPLVAFGVLIAVMVPVSSILGWFKRA